MPRNIVNIINFIRGVEPRSSVDLVEPVRRQLELGRRFELPTTWLVQFDAMIDPRFASLLAGAGQKDEIGGWFELNRPHVEAAGLKWRGRYDWDWHADVGFSIGYTPAEREKLVDVFMDKFQQTFGRWPASVGAWFIDAHTLGYMSDRYGIVASCNCKDQRGTDGYTLWGGHWGPAYYPSKRNAFMPAQGKARQIPVPIFRMLGSDPIYQYDAPARGNGQEVVTLEPVYPEAGGNPAWVRWFFDTMTAGPSLSFGYAQVGQENSFGWERMSAGLEDQMKLVAELSASGRVEVETLGASGRWFRQQFGRTPASAVVALKDWKNQGRRSIWYSGRFYRANLLWEGERLRIRDIHKFDQSYAERYLKQPCRTHECTYDTLPVFDGAAWGGGIELVKVAADGAMQPLAVGAPTATEENGQTLNLRVPLIGGGEMAISCGSSKMLFHSAAPGWALRMPVGKKAAAVEKVAPGRIYYRHDDFAYDVRMTSGVLRSSADGSVVRMMPEKGYVGLGFGGEK